jgi:hypothetical protein
MILRWRVAEILDLVATFEAMVVSAITFGRKEVVLPETHKVKSVITVLVGIGKIPTGIRR